MVVDQFAAWIAEERLPLLPKDGGFARLLREGTWVRALRYPYAVTDTAPGHASLHTGRLPAESGIFGNEIPDASGRRVTFLRDEAVKVVAPDGVRETAGSSAARLRVETVADRLRAARPDALVVSISVKDRGAIMPAGKKPTHAIWFDAQEGSFVTSTAFAREVPRWAVANGDARAVARARAAAWQPTDAAWIEANAKTKDEQRGEGDLDGLGTTFPHLAKTSAAFRATPAADETIFALALAAVSAEWRPSRTTLLLLSMSAADVIGHTFGPDSWEAWDHLRKLDLALGAFLDALEAKVGRVSVILSGDHGTVSMPEVRPNKAPCSDPSDPYERPRCTGVRLGPNAIRDELKAEAEKVLGSRDLIAGVADPYVYLSVPARALDPARRATLDKAVRRVFDRRKDAIAEVYDVRALPERCAAALATARGVPDRARPGEDVLTLVCRSWADGVGAGDYYVVPRLGSSWDGEVVVGKGTSHGTPYLHDRTVPMLVRAPPDVDAGAVITDPVDFTAYASIEAFLVGIEPRRPREILAASTASR
jgi:type I phosphodiesterase/nucleotide pyrophosphatase